MDFYTSVARRTRAKRDEHVLEVYNLMIKDKDSTSDRTPNPTTFKEVLGENKKKEKEAGSSNNVSKRKRGRPAKNRDVEELAEGDLIVVGENKIKKKEAGSSNTVSKPKRGRPAKNRAVKELAEEEGDLIVERKNKLRKKETGSPKSNSKRACHVVYDDDVVEIGEEKVEEKDRKREKEIGSSTFTSKSKRGRHVANDAVEELVEEEGDLIGVEESDDNSEDFEVEEIEKDDHELRRASVGTKDDSEDSDLEEIGIGNKMAKHVGRMGLGSKEAEEEEEEKVNEDDVAFKISQVLSSFLNEEEEEEEVDIDDVAFKISKVEGFNGDNYQAEDIEVEDTGDVNLTKSTGEADVPVNGKEGTCGFIHPEFEKEDANNHKKRRACEVLGTSKSVPQVKEKEDITSKPTKRKVFESPLDHKIVQNEEDDIPKPTQRKRDCGSTDEMATTLLGSAVNKGELYDPHHNLEVKELSPAEDPLPLKFRFGDESPVPDCTKT